MTDFKDIETVNLLVFFLVPGFIVLYVRSQFLTGKLPPASEAALPYLVFSLIYVALAAPVFEYLEGIPESGFRRSCIWFILIFVGPALLGAFLGFMAQKGPVRWIAQKLGANPVHPSPTAWDWWFAQPQDRWIIIVLKDGTKFGGYFGSRSFASTEPNERDIFVQKVYEINSDDVWKDAGDKGLLVLRTEISTLEFLPIQPQEIKSEQAAKVE